MALVLALMNFAIPLATGGAHGVVNRHRFDPGPRLLGRALGTGAGVALVVTGVGALLYPLDAWLDGLLLVSVLAGGATFLAAAHLQSQQRFGLSLALNQSSNYVVAIAALIVLAAGTEEAWIPLAVVAVGHVASALLGWGKLFAERPASPPADPPCPWREALSIAGVHAAALLLLQLERLVLPRVLGLEALASFGVLAAIALSPFRMLQNGVGYTLLPRLRAADTRSARRRLLVQEALVVAAVAGVAGLAIWTLGPWVVELLLGDKYDLAPALYLAALVGGAVRLASAFADATVTAVTGARELALLNAVGWVFVGVAVLGAVVGSRFGLAGVLYGAALGWVGRALLGAWLAWPALREPVGEPVPGGG